MGMFDTFVFECPNDGCDAIINQQTKAFGCMLDVINDGYQLQDKSSEDFDFTGYLRVKHYTEPHTCTVCKRNAYAVVHKGRIMRFCSQAEAESFEEVFKGEK